MLQLAHDCRKKNVEENQQYSKTFRKARFIISKVKKKKNKQTYRRLVLINPVIIWIEYQVE